MRRVYLLLGVVVALSASAQDQPPAPSVEDLVKGLSAFYMAQESFSTEYTEAMRIESQGMQQTMETKYFCAVQRPKRFALIHKSGMMGSTCVSDGTTLTTYIPSANRYIAEEAPETIEEIIEPMDTVSGPVSSGVVWKTLLGADPYAAIMDGVTKAEYVGLENAKHHVRLFQEQMIADMWIEDSETPWLSRLTFDLSDSMKGLLEKEGRGAEAMNFAIDFTFDRWTANPTLADDVFKFYPPAQAEEADNIYDVFGMEDTEEVASKLIDTPAPDFELEKLDGSKVRLSEHIGRDVVVLDFWASWCPPCIKGLPIVSDVTNIYSEKGVVFYALNQQETNEDVEAFLKETKLDINVLMDREGAVADQYAVDGIPQTVIIDKEGTIRSVHVGLIPNLDKKLTDELEAVLSAELVPDDISAPAE